jgi:lipopolysaccharide transport system ATP-binding protein
MGPRVDAFDPGLVPETTTVYPVQGAEIQSIQILNDDGQVVNVLQPGKTYSLRVTGHFLSDVDGVFFGIHFRSISGLVVTGQRHPEEGKYLGRIQAGACFRITFGFNMCLLPGVYFAGGGVWSYQDQNCLHRILDALMFRVVLEGPQKSFGYCDASSTEPILELS